MAVVSLLADIPSVSGLRESQAGRLVPDQRLDSENTLLIVDRLAHDLREHEAVVVVYPAWQAEAAERIVKLVRGAGDTDRLAGLPLNLPPLAFSLVTDQMAAMAPFMEPGRLVSVGHRLAGGVVAGAWVNSVARMQHVKTGLGEHLSSLVPKSGFMVSAGAGQSVHRITGAHPVSPFVRPLEGSVMVLAAHQGMGDTGWLERSFGPAIGAMSLTYVGDQPLSPRFWGTRKYVEFVAFNNHPHALWHTVQTTLCRSCPWCGEPTALERCSLCGMIQPWPPPVEAEALRPPVWGSEAPVSTTTAAAAPQAPYASEAPSAPEAPGALQASEAPHAPEAAAWPAPGAKPSTDHRAPPGFGAAAAAPSAAPPSACPPGSGDDSDDRAGGGRVADDHAAGPPDRDRSWWEAPVPSGNGGTRWTVEVPSGLMPAPDGDPSGGDR